MNNIPLPSRNMRDSLQNQDLPKSTSLGLGSAVLVGLLLTLPFAVLEFLNNSVTRRNALGLIVLFGLLWLFATTFIVILLLLVRTARKPQHPGESDPFVTQRSRDGAHYGGLGRYYTRPDALLSGRSELRLDTIDWSGSFTHSQTKCG
ncbi:MAG TPA: hypothetical protein VJT71_19480 [Pyrinomonadaceae bacterium]|nr:hypothetical protein [Pyrinomonadaceae bacterium]